MGEGPGEGSGNKAVINPFLFVAVKMETMNKLKK